MRRRQEGRGKRGEEEEGGGGGRGVRYAKRKWKFERRWKKVNEEENIK